MLGKGLESQERLRGLGKELSSTWGHGLVVVLAVLG